MIFKNRKDAGEKLAGLLSQYEGPEVMIFALPRGGVVLGFEIAKKLHAPLHLLITQKIGHPQNPEYAIASLAEDETVLYNPEEILTLNRQWLEMEIQKNVAKSGVAARSIWANHRPPLYMEKPSLLWMMA